MADEKQATKIAVADDPDEMDVEGTTDEFVAVTPEPKNASAVPGTPEDNLTLGEHTETVQPTAGVEVPATAEPAQDAVSVNNHLYAVLDRLEAVASYMREHLPGHSVAKTVGDNVESAKNSVSEALKV